MLSVVNVDANNFALQPLTPCLEPNVSCPQQWMSGRSTTGMLSRRHIPVCQSLPSCRCFLRPPPPWPLYPECYPVCGPLHLAPRIPLCHMHPSPMCLPCMATPVAATQPQLEPKLGAPMRSCKSDCHHMATPLLNQCHTFNTFTYYSHLHLHSHLHCALAAVTLYTSCESRL